MTARPSGVIAPLVTPMGFGPGVSEEGIDGQIQAVRPWVSGLMPCISSGEGWRLTQPQWRATVEATIRMADGLPVYAGCQASDWRTMERRALEAEQMGADAIVISIPARHGHSSTSTLLEKFGLLRRALGGPVVYYLESFVSGWDVGADLGVRICEELDAVAVKDSMRNAQLTSELLERLAGRTNVLQGWEDMLSPDLPVDGYVGPLALLSECTATLFSSDPQWVDIARETERFGVLDRDYIARVKAELHLRGLIPSAAEFPGVRGVAWDS
jgi:4-hydroxy-tetrahydrodipicolinate synthase